MADTITLLQETYRCHSIFELRDISVKMGVLGGLECIQITGRVSSFYHKQLAQETAKVISTDFPIDNRLEVS